MLHSNQSKMPLKCPKCQRAYVSELKLKRHWYHCGMPSVYQCPLCLHSTKYKPGIVRHVKLEHQELDEKSYATIMEVIQAKASDMKSKFYSLT